MKPNKNLKPIILDIEVTEENDSEFEYLALVKKGAIQDRWTALSALEEKQTEKLFVEMSIQDEDSMILIGKVLIPDFPILRGYEEETGAPIFINFSEEAIFKLNQKFGRSNFKMNVNEMHTKKMVDAYVFENWQVEDPVKDKAAIYYGEDVKKGTMLVRMQITDRDYWNANIKTGILTGFSIEGMMNFKLPDTNPEESKLQELYAVLEKIDSLLIPTIYTNIKK